MRKTLGSFIIFSLLFTLLSCSKPTVDDKLVFSAIFDRKCGCEIPGAEIVIEKATATQLKNAGVKPNSAYGDYLKSVNIKNLPVNQKYSFYLMRVNFEPMKIADFVQKPDCEYAFQVITDAFGFMNGEWIAFLVFSENKKSYVCKKVIPQPIEINWEDGASTSLIMISPDASNFMVESKGYLPNEQLFTLSKSGDETSPLPVKANPAGKWTLMLEPGVSGQAGGTASFEITRFSTEEKKTVEYFWGTEAAKHIMPL